MAEKIMFNIPEKQHIREFTGPCRNPTELTTENMLLITCVSAFMKHCEICNKKTMYSIDDSFNSANVTMKDPLVYYCSECRNTIMMTSVEADKELEQSKPVQK